MVAHQMIKDQDILLIPINSDTDSETVAANFWGGENSGLEAWDLITPNRVSSNIGEFAILLPRPFNSEVQHPG